MQFFIAPLISPDGIARERQAVDSEHSKNLQNDGWRQQQLWKEVANPQHRFSRFFTGSLETLGTIPESQSVDVHKELVDFYHREYSAGRMKLCILGRESLDELQAMVQAKFEPVIDKGALHRNASLGSMQRRLRLRAEQCGRLTLRKHGKTRHFEENHYRFSNDNFLSLVSAGLPVGALHEGEPYPASLRGSLISVLPVKDGHSLSLRWIVPCLDDLWAENPAGFLGHMIGHEGDGSLFALLKAKGWVKSLSAGGFAFLRGNSQFSISMRLTDAGALAISGCKELHTALLFGLNLLHSV